ncbi:MAG TPA: cobalamin-binding protein [Verrucomicrobiae bacterium]|nr:cobalamin-binding protein [Verrucomicrobiae bacterium]
MPAATEMVFALGFGDWLVGVSHECDFPPQAKEKPIVVRPALPLDKLSLREIDESVSARLRDGESLYKVDENLLRSLAPDLILTQNLCQVCAPSGNEVSQTLKTLPKKPKVLYLSPHSISDIFENVREVGKATGCLEPAEALIADSCARLEKISSRTRVLKKRPRVFCCEWLDPIYCSGHWVPEMVELAGGIDSLSRKGADSIRVEWEEIVNHAPEIFIVSPCGFDLQKALEQAPQLFGKPGWRDLPAVKNNQVYAVDANSCFARPGLRVVEGVELLAHLFHPEIFSWRGASDAFRPVAK